MKFRTIIHYTNGLTEERDGVVPSFELTYFDGDDGLVEFVDADNTIVDERNLDRISKLEVVFW